MIAANPYTSAVTFISAERNHADFIRLHPDLARFMTLANTPSSLDMDVSDVAMRDVLINALTALPGVEDVKSTSYAP